jgi:hypothetical protein
MLVQGQFPKPVCQLTRLDKVNPQLEHREAFQVSDWTRSFGTGVFIQSLGQEFRCSCGNDPHLIPIPRAKGEIGIRRDICFVFFGTKTSGLCLGARTNLEC